MALRTPKALLELEMGLRQVRLSLAIVILLLSITLLAWGFWPVLHQERNLDLSPAEMMVPSPSSLILHEIRPS
jgi:hypothetical protein